MSRTRNSFLIAATLALPGCGDETEGRPVLANSPQNPTSRPSQAKAPGPSSAPTEPSVFARFVPVGDDEGRFETAIVTYQNDDGIEVSLIGAIHIADAPHYAELNREFERYDALLYELVAPETYRPKPGDSRAGGGVLSMLQNAMKRGLELEFQLDGIDYTPENFVHADLTPSGFQDEMEKNDESILSIMFNMMVRQNRHMQRQAAERDETGEPAPSDDLDFVKAFRTGEGRHLMRMTFAKSLMEIESLVAGADPDGSDHSVLLEGRNDRALEVLSEQIGAGKRKIGIYYGAAHMPDFERKLATDFGFRRTGDRWLRAWNIDKRPDETRK